MVRKRPVRRHPAGAVTAPAAPGRLNYGGRVTLISDPDVWVQALATAGLPPMRARGDLGGDFRAELAGGALGAVRLAELIAPGGACFRDEAGVRAGDHGFCQIYLGIAGQSRMEQDGRTAQLGTAALVVIDPALPLEVTTTRAHFLTLLVPEHLLGVEPGDLTRLRGRRIAGDVGAGALLASLARAAVRSGGDLGAEEASRSGVAIAELTTAVLAAQLPRGRRSPDETLRAGVRAFVATRLRQPDLNPASIAAAHHISVRRLHQLFREEPFTVAALIRHSRLERCRADLAAPEYRGQSVAVVAARWGFTDPAHFSRLFKAEYGLTASEARRPDQGAAPISK